MYDFPLKCTSKIRYRQEPNPVTIQQKEDTIVCEYTEEQRGIAPGQTLVAYLEDECIGSGTITTNKK